MYPSGITGTFTSGGSNLLEDPNAAADGFTGPHDQVGVTNFGFDPEGLQYNGGPDAHPRRDRRKPGHRRRFQ